MSEPNPTPDRSGETAEASDFAQNTFQSMFDLFWDPEIERRGGLEVTGPLRKALAIMRTDQPVEILLNEEADLVFTAEATGPINRGDPLYAEDIGNVSDLRPLRIDEEAGWVAYAVLPNGQGMLAFDFRRNRGRGRRLLHLAREYLEVAQDACAAGHERPAVEAAHACAELVVTAMMYLTDEAPASGVRSPHGKRKHWLNVHTHLGNAPVRFHETLVRLAELRPSARYGEDKRQPASGEVGKLVDVLREMIDHAAERVGEPLPEIDDLDKSEIRPGRRADDRRRDGDVRPAS
ncbi:HEPN domain-containing protein [Kribbella sp. NPDC003505]|uniref:HEPN domain-containing protein n=1 Tax=Kribbella sp. NPDC003505 TaxID=3154448 RepID=UPI00339FD9ED